ncbi:lipoprotein LpqV [Mycolicibacterium fallax]|uniref:Uncharacterized protein n=1 Tax=Mycolicibacterium fallax TaxID=1793 RepID=A0A1X1RL24_MYCFA|nr:lipoprotein LpqV [Mycolicibacterium fallax]ORV08506.1 hypothetical protein AWC04_02175 [Mycolicibacterium fallax]BBZ00288.1 hypothetical protein MFAL_37540 [Mycolicibacterium fallax]HOW93265.1 lipoprotein LpqV [Mycolicibacterium fallax]HSA39429.1 lipoprotein LpqV [Mycobacterium sp.]
MRSAWMPAVLFTVALAAVTTGCSSGDGAAPAGRTAPAPQATAPAPEAKPDGIEVSAAGVTTKVQAPADATESGYGQACLAAKAWLDERGGEPTEQVEPYLSTLQDPGYAGPGTFGSPWAELRPGQQAGAIMAVEHAAAGLCG